jgi:transcription elongation factor Elf1
MASSEQRERGISPGFWRLAVGVAVEHRFMCPYCGEEISMILDFSVPSQVYVEDCEVCCSPIEISYSAEDDELASFQAKRLE